MADKTYLKCYLDMQTEHTDQNGILKWPKLVRGTLVKRYKRFLADVKLDDGKRITAHCPNTGSMKGCSESGQPVYLSLHDNPRRKLKYTWELIEMPTSLVGVNTLVPNRLCDVLFYPENGRQGFQTGRSH